MEILVTIVAFWLILVGAYGAYSLTQNSASERAPRVRTQHPVTLATAGGSSPFGPVTLPSGRVPSFIANFAPPAAPAGEPSYEVPEPVYAERYEEPVRNEAPLFEALARPAKTRTSRVEPRFEPPARPEPSEVDFLRAQVDHLRSEIYALSDRPSGRTERPQQRRYRPGIYTHLPPTLQRQVNEARGFRRFLHN